MRLLHVADLHQGLTTHSRPAEGGIPSALLSTARCWNAAIDAGLEAEVDLVVVAGDVFHDANPDAESLALFAEGLRRLHEIPVLIIAGNHDRAPHDDRHSVLTAFRRGLTSEQTAAGASRFVWTKRELGLRFVSTKPEFVTIGDLNIGTLPSVTRHRLMAHSPMPRREADLKVADALEKILADYRLLDVDLIVGHWGIEGSMLGAEADMSIVDEPVIPKAAVSDGPWAYGAFGHIHKGQVVTVAPDPGASVVAYSGSIDRVSFAEERESKAALIVDIGSDGVTIKPVAMPARRFVTIELGSVSGGDVNVDLGTNAIEGELVGAVVRIRATLTPDLDAQRFTSRLREPFLALGADVVVFQLERPREHRPSVEAIKNAATPADQIRAWAEANGLDTRQTSELVDIAAELRIGG